MSITIEDFKKSLERHNAEFEALLGLIPAKYYLVPDDVEEHVREMLSLAPSYN